MLVKLSQFRNASAPTLFTLSGMVTLVKPLQPENAPPPMLVTLSGIVMLVKPLHPLNALSPMLVTLPSMGITLFLHPAISVLLAVSIKQFPTL